MSSPAVPFNPTPSAVQGTSGRGGATLAAVQGMSGVWSQSRPSTSPTNPSSSAFARPQQASSTPDSFLGNMSGSELASTMKRAGLMSRTAMTLPPGEDGNGVNHKFYADVQHAIDGRFAFILLDEEESKRTGLVQVKSVEEINAMLAVGYANKRRTGGTEIDDAYEMMDNIRYIGHVQSETTPQALAPFRGSPMYKDTEGKLVVSRLQGTTRIYNMFGDSTKIGMYLHMVMRPTVITTTKFIFPNGESHTIPAEAAELGSEFMPLQLVYIVSDEKSLGPEETEYEVVEDGVTKIKHAPSKCLGLFSAQFPKRFAKDAPRTFHPTNANHGVGNTLIDFNVLPSAEE